MMFHGSLTLSMVKMFQYFESPSYAILLNSGKIARYFKSPYYYILLNIFDFSIFALYTSVIGLHLQLHFSTNVRN